ncbi:MAG: hypothetical protein ACLFVU_03015 [Phycisphaerae bacterium]
MKKRTITAAVGALVLMAGLAQPLHAGTQEGTNPKKVEIRPTDRNVDRIAAGDEIDQLEKKIKPKARFEGYQPKWKVEGRTFSWKHHGKTVTKDHFKVILDGDRVVGLVRSGDIMLIARTPDTASSEIKMPTERLHLDNLLGPSLPTYQFIKRVKTHGSIYKTLGDKAIPEEYWESDGRHLTFVRKQTLPKYQVEARFILTVDPVYGYRIDAVRDVLFNDDYKAGKVKMNLGSFCPGCYVPWDYAAIYDRTAWTPATGGVQGWANNLVTMDRCDSDHSKFVWRDDGFITYMPERKGWSPVFTRADGTGNTPPLALCNAHNDFHLKIILKDLPKTKTGGYRFKAVHRLMSLPPEMTAHVWDNVDLIQKNATAIIIKLGKTEDFENQPVKLTEPARGLTWTSGGPDIVKGDAHSGKQSIRIEGRDWPNLPQVSLKPNTRYRLEGWFKIQPYTKEQIQKLKARDARRREKLKKKGKPLPPEKDYTKLDPKAWIQGDFYEWSPYSGKMLVKQKTSVATKPGTWQHVKLDFDSPDWGPFINIAFHAEDCTALLDDFALRELGPIETKEDSGEKE